MIGACSCWSVTLTGEMVETAAVDSLFASHLTIYFCSSLSIKHTSHNQYYNIIILYMFSVGYNFWHYLDRYLAPPLLCIFRHQEYNTWSALPLSSSEETLLLNKVVFSDMLPTVIEGIVDSDTVLFFKCDNSNFSGLLKKKARGERARYNQWQ